MRNRVHDIELDEFVSDQMECPSSITFGCFRTGDHGDISFDLIVEYHGPSYTWLIVDHVNYVIIRLLMILLSYIIDGGSSAPEKLSNLLIVLALMRQEQGSGAVDVSGLFVTSAHLGGQKVIFVLG